MRIARVSNTELFVGTEQDPQQVLRVELADVDQAGSIEVSGAGGTGRGSFEPNASVVEVGLTGVTLAPATVSLRGADGTEHGTDSIDIVPAQPGWTVWMVPHFHYDPVWWNTQAAYTDTWDEAGDEAQRFRMAFQQTGFALVKLHLTTARRDPDYKFVLAEVDYLKPYWDAHPEDRAYLRQLLAEGRLEIMGGTYNEPNTNLTSAETTARNFVYGDGFQRGVLGADPQTAWQLDAFGHDPQFPGMAADSGLNSSSWARGPFHQWGPMLWTAGPEDGWGDPSVMQFPAEFEWISPSGHGVLTHYMPAHYSAGWQIDSKTSLAEAEQATYDLFLLLKRVAATRNVLLPVGTDYTPPSKWVTEIHRDWAQRYVWPRFECAIPRDFFDAVRAELSTENRTAVPQTRDMNPIYTGKDVSYIDTKQAQRQAENLLLDAEKFATAAMLHGAEYPHLLMDKAWRQLVYGAHHDAITGSESDQVYIDLLTGWREAHDIGRQVLARSTQYLDTLVNTGYSGDDLELTVYNPSSWYRRDQVSVTVDLPALTGLILLDPDDHPKPVLLTDVSRTDDGRLVRATLTFEAEVPPLGYSAGWRVRGVGAGNEVGWQDVEGSSIDSVRHRVTVDASRGGGVSELIDKQLGRNLLQENQIGNELVLHHEYSEHPKFHEGPWHLVPNGGRQGSGESAATSVRKQVSPLGERLIVTGELAGIRYEQQLTLWREGARLECSTSLDDFNGADLLVRLRWPIDAPGGLPVSEVGDAVVGRGFGLIDVDSADHPWTLDNPAYGWFGVSSTARVRVREAGSGSVGYDRAIGIAELIAPNAGGLTRDLAVALAGQGVTATSSRGDGPRYGRLAVDSNLPDVRIAIGGPEDNDFVAARLTGADPQYRLEIEKQLAESGAARVWVPADLPLPAAWVPSADLSDPASLPVLIVVGEAQLAALISDIADAVIEVQQHAAGQTAGEAPLADVTVGLLNRGIPGFAVDAEGSLHLSLLRSCTGWPSGVWIDPPRRTAVDGSNFQQEHWSQHFEYGVVTGSGDWRGNDLVRAGHDYNHVLQAVAHRPGGSGRLPQEHSFLTIEPADRVVLAALKPRGNPLAAGRSVEQAGPVTVRLYEATGSTTQITVRMPGADNKLQRLNILEQPADGPVNEIGPMQIATLGLTVAIDQPSASVYGAQGEPHQPIYTRYWLNNTGPAPRGNVLESVHLTPSLVESGEPTELTVRVASTLADHGSAGQVDLLLPEGWTASPSTLEYAFGAGEFSASTVTVIPAADAAPGTYWVRARIASGGQQLEDLTRFVIGGQLEPELQVSIVEPSLSVPPGGSETVTVRLTSHARTEISLQSQLIGPWQTWSLIDDWNTGASLQPGQSVELRYAVQVPPAARPGAWWVLAKVSGGGVARYTEPIALIVQGETE